MTNNRTSPVFGPAELADRVVTDPTIVYLRECGFRPSAYFEATLRTAIIKACAARPDHAPTPDLPVAWIAFADNGNVRFWTSDPHRSQREKERGLDLRAFTMAELIALISRIPTAPQGPDTSTVRQMNEENK